MLRKNVRGLALAIVVIAGAAMVALIALLFAVGAIVGR
jgi:hypothetical protein